jgi:hypothetical protein
MVGIILGFAFSACASGRLPYRGERRQAANRAAANFEGHPAAAKFGQPG